MKKVLLGIAALVLSQAHAADLIGPAYMPTKAVAPYMSVFSWTGLYVGGNIGYGWAARAFDVAPVDPNSQAFFATLANPGSLDQTTKGVVGGGQAGYNIQFGSWVIGGEFLFDWTNMSSSAGQTAMLAAAPAIPAATLSSGVRVDWDGALNARLGFVPSPNWMIAGFGGFAFGNISTNAAVTCIVQCGIFGFSNGTSNTHTGWDAGAEIKYALISNIIAGLRYRYVDLGNQGLFVQSGGAQPSTFLAGTSARFNEFGFTLDYKF